MGAADLAPLYYRALPWRPGVGIPRRQFKFAQETHPRQPSHIQPKRLRQALLDLGLGLDLARLKAPLQFHPYGGRPLPRDGPFDHPEGIVTSKLHRHRGLVLAAPHQLSRWHAIRPGAGKGEVDRAQ